MKLIFENGDKLYKKEQSLNANILENVYGIKLYTYQKQIINSIIKDENFDHCIYGDDFKIELISRNIENRCAITIKDYDENQKFENDICVDFNKDEKEILIMNDVVVYTIPEGDWEALYVNGELKAQGRNLLIAHLKQYTPIQSIKEIHIENFDSDRDYFPKKVFEFPDEWGIRVR